MKTIHTLLLLAALAANAQHVTPASLSAATSAEELTAGLQSPDALTRATAARVAMLRNVSALLPQIRESLSSEKDGLVAREELRALVLLGSDADVSAAVAQSAKWPAPMDDVIADAVARRAVNALDIYHSKLSRSRMSAHTEFFRQMLWTRGAIIPVVASQLLSWHDAAGWSGLLQTAADSGVTIPVGAMTVSMGMAEDPIRDASVWYLVHTYAVDPSVIRDPLRAALLESRAEVPAREQFGRELLRRMLGGERKADARWQKFLAGDEAKSLFRNESADVLQYLTEAELLAMGMPAVRAVRQPALEGLAGPTLIVPSLLPAGLADALLADARCSDGWLGVANVTVDGAGRVQSADLKNVSTTSDGCRRVAEKIVRLSLATPTSILSQNAIPVVLIRSPKARLCIDEPALDVTQRLLRVAGGITAPVIDRRVSESFVPPGVRRVMGRDAKITLAAEIVVTRDGCVRNARLVKQSPLPDLNSEWLLFLARSKFAPAHLDDKPVDVIYQVTIGSRGF